MKFHAALFSAILFLSACSPVKIFSDAEMKKPSGLKYYTVKPFLQIEKDIQTNAVLKTTVIYLPDLQNPQYLKVSAGVGSGKLDLAFNNGSIEKFGFSSDSEIPDYIKALASTISESAGAVKDLSSLKGIPQAGAQSVVELYEIIMDGEGTRLKKVEIK